MKTSFLCARSSALRGQEWLEGKSGLETRIPLLREPGRALVGWVGSPTVQAKVSVSSPHLYMHFIIRSVSWRLDFRNFSFPKSGAPDTEIQNPALISLVPWA